MISSLTSIRFIFIFFIFLFHCRFLPVHYFDNAGSAGVTFFFILSGFILSYSYKNIILTVNFSKKDFIIKRLVRVYPLHLLVLFIYLLLLFNSDKFVWQYLDYKWAAKLILNILLLQSYVPRETVIFSFSGMWFLSTLIFSYLMFPYLMNLINKFRYKSALFLLIIPALILLLPKQFSITLFYANPIFRVFDFFAGMLGYEIFTIIQNKKFTIIAATSLEIICIALWMLFYIAALLYDLSPYSYSLFFWLPSLCLIIVLALSTGLISKILSWHWLVTLGTLSLGFFVFHPTIIRFIDFILIIQNAWLKMVIIAVTTLICSYLSLHYFEKPIRFSKIWQ